MDKPRQPKVTYEAVPVVWIHVKGERSAAEQPALPVAPRDGGLVQRLLTFMREKDIYRAIQSGYAGAGEYAGGFYEPHAKMIVRFLRKEGCKRRKQK